MNKWTFAGKSLEARIYCTNCNKSNVVWGSDTNFFWEAVAMKPIRGFICDHCGEQMTVKLSKIGVEIIPKLTRSV